MTAEAITDPEGIALVNRIHIRKLTADLARQVAHHAALVSQAQALSTRPEAADLWELVHEAAGNTARTLSRLTQARWTT